MHAVVAVRGQRGRGEPIEGAFACSHPAGCRLPRLPHSSGIPPCSYQVGRAAGGGQLPRLLSAEATPPSAAATPPAVIRSARGRQIPGALWGQAEDSSAFQEPRPAVAVAVRSGEVGSLSSTATPLGLRTHLQGPFCQAPPPRRPCPGTGSPALCHSQPRPATDPGSSDQAAP